MLHCFVDASALSLILSISLLANATLLGDQPRAAPQSVPKPAGEQAKLLVSDQVAKLAEKSAASMGNITQDGPATIEAKKFYAIDIEEQKLTVAHVSIVGLQRFSFVVVLDALSGDVAFSSIDSFPTATDIIITSFGSESDWFIWLQSWNLGLSNGAPLQRQSSVVLVDGKFDCAVTVDHFANDLAFTSTPEQTKLVGASGIFFTGKDRQTGIPNHRAENASGKIVIPALVWDSRRRKFVGPQMAKMSDATIMEVNTQDSKFYVEKNAASLASLLPAEASSE